MDFDEADELYRRQQEEEKLNQSIKDMEHLERAVAVRNQRLFLNWRERTIEDEIKKAAEEFGLSKDDLSRHMSDPRYEKDLRGATRKMVEKAAKRVKGSHPGERRPGNRVETRSRGRAFDTELAEAKQKAQRGQLSEDEQIGILNRILGNF
jgi:hypothetical protein